MGTSNFARLVARTTALFVSLSLAGFAGAAMAPPPETEKTQIINMLDARVNAKDAWRRSMAARPQAAQRQAEASSAAATLAAVAASQMSANPGLAVRSSSLTGAPTSVSHKAGSLTAAAPGKSSEAIVRDYLRGSAGTLMGLSSGDVDDLNVLGDSAGGYSGLRMLRVEQQIGGRPIFQSETRFLLDSSGRLMKHVGIMVPQARLIAPPEPTNKLSAAAASSKLFTSLGKTIPETSFNVSTPAANARTELTSTDDFVSGPVSAREVLFPLAPGVLVPAWSVVAFTSGKSDWYAIIDAQTGDVLWRKNIRNYVSTHEARFRVYVQADGKTPADSPAPLSPRPPATPANFQPPEILPTIVNMSVAQDIIASPNGWIDDCPGGVCTANETQTLGNNVLACLDRVGGGVNTNACDTDAASVLDGNGRPTGNPDANTRNRDFLGTSPRDFQTNFLPAPQGGNPEAGQTPTGAGNGTSTGPTDIFRRGVVTHLFYLTNWYHDQTFRLGFDEASANFQQTNFSGMGLGGDRVLADAQDSAGTNNANFSTPPDGVSGRMQMFRFTGPTVDRDGSLDAEIVLHELTHGLSNRLVGNGAGLNWEPAGGLGEGWSDFYALALLNNTATDDPDGMYATGAYATYKLGGLLDNYQYGIRRFPYSTDISVNPLTWGDADDVTNNLTGGIAPSPLDFNGGGALEVHNSGEIWANTLWQMRANMIADPAGANGNRPLGNRNALQLVTDGLKMTPIDPTFTDARDALVDADCAANACANEVSIWSAFAKRGLGWGAETPYNQMFGFTAGHMGVKESFNQPYLDVANPLTDVAIIDTASNNNGAIDPGESFFMTVKLFNPWRAASKSAAAGFTATLTTSTPGVTIYTATATYGAIGPQASVVGGQFKLGVSNAMTAGAPIDFTLTTASSLGVTVTTFRVRVGTRSGTDPVVTYTRSAVGLAIPDGAPRGVSDTLAVTDDLEIADLDFRVDSLTHTFTGDLSVMLRSPGGLGADFVSLIGALVADSGSGDNITNMVIDDDLPFTAANDMVQAVATQAPFTKSWLPTFNSPWAALAGFPDLAGSTGNLSRFDGRSTKGTWTVLVSDQFSVDTGTLQGWSMLVTPVHFNISPFAASALVTATKTVSGTFRVGQTVTYSVVLTNTGTGNQADNAGNEFTDVLPSGLTLVSATATGGTAATAGNTVTWNGALAPLGGTVTITITATINPGTQGTTISNQGTVAFDSAGNGTNGGSAPTDNPALPGAADPTNFVVGNAILSATKVVSSGTHPVGSTVTYTVVLSNSGNTASPDNAGNEFTDVLPAGLTLTSASVITGTASVAGNTVSWNGSVPAGGSVTITITATINAGTQGTVISNQGTLLYDADLNGSNETTVLTDDPTIVGPANPTVFTVNFVAVTATKTVSAGPYRVNDVVTYTITLANTGNTATTDNPGNELTDVLPTGLSLLSASATSGTAVALSPSSTVTWNGSVPAAGSVTITISALLNPSAASRVISNQATYAYDADLNGSNESTGVSDDPAVAGAANPTAFTAEALPPIPTASSQALWLLALMLMGMGALRLRSKRRM